MSGSLDFDILGFVQDHDRERFDSEGFTTGDVMATRGINRSKAAHLINKWMDQGVIEPTGKKVVLPDRAGRMTPRPTYRPTNRLPEVKERKLGRHKADGLYLPDGTIEIDPRIRGKRRLEVLIHEIDHHLHPEKTEEAVTKDAEKIAEILWRERVRIIDEA